MAELQVGDRVQIGMCIFDKIIFFAFFSYPSLNLNQHVFWVTQSDKLFQIP